MAARRLSIGPLRETALRAAVVDLRFAQELEQTIPYLAEEASGRNSHARRKAISAWQNAAEFHPGASDAGAAPMLGIHDLWLFIISGLILNITPGPDTAYIVGRSAQFGWRGGAAAALGISTGCLVHVVACAIGLSALLAASATAFTLVKWAGAAYLCIIGIRMLLTPTSKPADASPRRDSVASPPKVFWQGALTNVLNPKVALFFLAFLPQFVDAETPHKALAFLALGLIFILNGTLWCLAVAAFAARTARHVRQSGRAMRWINRALGGMFIYLGARLALLQTK
jgi:threonine/homoserine/homoserine lactone efflux protein